MPEYRIWLCGGDDGTRVVPNPECPRAELHTPAPPGYLQWHEWAEAMSGEHHQIRCEGCGLLHVWVENR